MTPRSLARHEKAEARKKEKAERDAIRAKAAEERKRKKLEAQSMSGVERDEARRKALQEREEKETDEKKEDSPEVALVAAPGDDKETPMDIGNRHASAQSTVAEPLAPSKQKDEIDITTLTPRSLKRHNQAAARKKAKADREAARKKATEERKKQQEDLKKLSGKERDEARRAIQKQADKAREEQDKERQADWAVQDAAREEVKVDKSVEEYMKKKELERAEAARKKKEEDERLARITNAVQDGDRYSSKAQVSIKKVGTYAWTGWHSRYISLGYRELRIYKKKKHADPGATVYIAPGSLVRYIPKLQPWGEGPIHMNNLELMVVTHEKNDAKQGLVVGKTERDRHRACRKVKPDEKQQKHVLRLRLSFASEKTVIRWMFALIEFIPSVFSLLQNNRSPIMDEVRAEVVEEAVVGKVKLERMAKHADLQTFLHDYGDDGRYIGRKRLMKDLYLTEMDPDNVRILKEWPKSLGQFLQPKQFKAGFQALVKSDNIFSRATWDHLVAYTGLSASLARAGMNQDSTRHEMLTASETIRKAELEKIALNRRVREERQKKEAAEAERQRQNALVRRQKAMKAAAEEEAERLKVEAKLVVPHDHLFVKVEEANPTGDAYCPICRQLAWQKQHDEWQGAESKKREDFIKEWKEKSETEEACRAAFDAQQKRSWLIPGTKEEKKENVRSEKHRRKKFDRNKKKTLQKETERRATWDKADARYRKEELLRRGHEDKIVRHYKRVRSYYLQAIVKFRDRGNVRRFLWQGILDPVHIISTSAMRHYVFDEALERMLVLNIIACESQINVDMIAKRAEVLRKKTLGTRCPGLVRVHDTYVQASEGNMGSRGFTVLVISEHCPRGNLRDVVLNAPANTEAIGETILLRWAHSIASAMDHMHSRKHGDDGADVHGAIQPSNILLSAEQDAKLGDYPFPRTQDVLNLRNLSKAKDVWDYGCTFYTVMTKGLSVQLNLKGQLAIPLERLLRTVPVRFGAALRNVLRRCLVTNERARGTAAEIFKILDDEVKRRESERQKREFRMLLLQKVFNLIMDGNDGVLSKTLLYQRLSDKNDLRFTGILGQDPHLMPLLDIAKFEPIVMRTKTANEGFINCSELLEIMDQAEQTRQRELASLKREAELAARFEVEAVSGDVALNVYA